MLFATAGQGALLVWMTGCGACVVIWYALTALLRRFVRAGSVLTPLIDLLFGLGAALIFLYFLYVGNRGAFRPFTLFGTLLGAAVFYFGLRAPVLRLDAFLRANFDRILTGIRENHLINVIFR